MKRYTSVAIALHWAIAALILLNLYIGWTMAAAEGLEKFERFQLHKSVGVTVLLLSVLRLGWRLTHRPPALPETMHGWEKLGAVAAHWGFYAIMIGMPLTGWLVVSASPYNLPTLLYKTVPWPHLPVHDLAMPLRLQIESGASAVHEALAFGTVALLLLHVGAALKHHFIARDDILSRMIPFLSPRNR